MVVAITMGGDLLSTPPLLSTNRTAAIVALFHSPNLSPIIVLAFKIYWHITFFNLSMKLRILYIRKCRIDKVPKLTKYFRTMDGTRSATKYANPPWWSPLSELRRNIFAIFFHERPAACRATSTAAQNLAYPKTWTKTLWKTERLPENWGEKRPFMVWGSPPHR